jgi:hypothetical protein
MDGDLSFPSHVANRYEMKDQIRGKIEEKPDAQEISEGAKSFVPAAIRRGAGSNFPHQTSSIILRTYWVCHVALKLDSLTNPQPSKEQGWDAIIYFVSHFFQLRRT